MFLGVRDGQNLRCSTTVTDAPMTAATAIAPLPASDGAPKAEATVLAAPLPVRPRIASEIRPYPPSVSTKLINQPASNPTTTHVTNISRFTISFPPRSPCTDCARASRLPRSASRSPGRYRLDVPELALDDDDDERADECGGNYREPASGLCDPLHRQGEPSHG